MTYLVLQEGGGCQRAGGDSGRQWWAASTLPPEPAHCQPPLHTPPPLSSLPHYPTLSPPYPPTPFGSLHRTPPRPVPQASWDPQQLACPSLVSFRWNRCREDASTPLPSMCAARGPEDSSGTQRPANSAAQTSPTRCGSESRGRRGRRAGGRGQVGGPAPEFLPRPAGATRKQAHRPPGSHCPVITGHTGP